MCVHQELDQVLKSRVNSYVLEKILSTLYGFCVVNITNIADRSIGLLLADEPSGLPLDGPYIHEVLWNKEMHGSITRKIVNETHSEYSVHVRNMFNIDCVVAERDYHPSSL